jgi:hypothetical protein
MTGSADQQMEIFVSLAWRTHSLAHRAAEMLDRRENEVEDPELLKGLFTVGYVDAVATVMSRWWRCPRAWCRRPRR